MSEPIVIPESNRWADFAWPAWIPKTERCLIEEFWSEKWGRGPRAWAKSEADPYNGGVRTGERARMWSLGARVVVIGRFVHRWNNIGAIVRDDGTSEAVAGRASDESIERHTERLAAKMAEHERAIERLRAEADALRESARA